MIFLSRIISIIVIVIFIFSPIFSVIKNTNAAIDCNHPKSSGRPECVEKEKAEKKQKEVEDEYGPLILMGAGVTAAAIAAGVLENFNPLAVPFGGVAPVIIPCTCTGGAWMLIRDKRTKLPLPIVFEPAYSKLSSIQNISGLYLPFTEKLGTFQVGGVCWVGIPPFCAPIPALGTVTPFPGAGMGTTALPTVSI